MNSRYFHIEWQSQGVGGQKWNKTSKRELLGALRFKIMQKIKYSSRKDHSPLTPRMWSLTLESLGNVNKEYYKNPLTGKCSNIGFLVHSSIGFTCIWGDRLKNCPFKDESLLETHHTEEVFFYHVLLEWVPISLQFGCAGAALGLHASIIIHSCPFCLSCIL